LRGGGGGVGNTFLCDGLTFIVGASLVGCFLSLGVPLTWGKTQGGGGRGEGAGGTHHHDREGVIARSGNGRWGGEGGSVRGGGRAGFIRQVDVISCNRVGKWMRCRGDDRSIIPFISNDSVIDVSSKCCGGVDMLVVVVVVLFGNVLYVDVVV
jgi:hypothetical protein